jgi:ribose 5-phosphate isomerase B
MSISVSIGCDHAGYQLKNDIIQYLSELDYTIYDYGTGTAESVDYPDYAHAVVGSLIEEECQKAILICGTGNGICMTANKWRDVRAALCWNTEIAELARQHNNANILCLPARFLTTEQALEVVKVFFSTEFEGGRHQKRVEKINPTFN